MTRPALLPALVALTLGLAACGVPTGEPLIAPDGPIDAVEARWAVDTLYVELAGSRRWAEEADVQLEVEVFDAQDRSFRRLTGALERPEDETHRQTVWWLIGLQPAVLTARVRVDGRVVFDQRIDDIDVRRPEEACGAIGPCHQGFDFAGAPPSLSNLRVVATDEAMTVTFESHDPDDDVTEYAIRWVFDGEPDLWWYPIALDGRVFDFEPGVWRHFDGEVERDGPWHRVRYSTVYGGDFDRLQVEVRAVDARDNSVRAIVDVEPAAPVAVGLGATCDPLAVEYTCPAEHPCSHREGGAVFTCRDPAGTCPYVVRDLPVQGVIDGDWQTPGDPTVLSCSGYLGEPETPRETHVFRYTAERAGRHGFEAARDGGISAIAVRRQCDLPRTELSCGNTRYSAARLHLEPGETVYVLVQRPIERVVEASPWAGFEVQPDYAFEILPPEPE